MTAERIVVTNARGASFAEVARWSGAFGALPGDTDAQVLEKFADYAIEENPGFKGDKGDPGGNVMAIGLFDDLTTLSIPGGTDAIRSGGWGVSGTGAAFYTLVDSGDVAALPDEGEGVWWATSSNGRTFELNEFEPNLYQYGAVAGSSVNSILPIADRHVMRTGSTLVIPPARFLFSGSLGGTTTSWTRIWATKPQFKSDDSQLQNGSILQGSLWIKSPFADVRGLGVDHGSAWFTGTPNDAIKMSPFDNATGLPMAGAFLHVEGLRGLGTQDTGYHSLLIENHTGYVNDIEGHGNQYGVGLKLTKSTARAVRSFNPHPDGRGIIIKTDAVYGGHGSNDFSDFVAESTNNAAYGISFNAADGQQMERLAVRGLRSTGAIRPLALEANAAVGTVGDVGYVPPSVINDITISDAVLASGTGGNATHAPVMTVGNVTRVRIEGSVLKPNLTQRTFILTGGLTLDFANCDGVVPVGGVMNAGQVGAGVGRVTFSNFRLTQNGDPAVPASINFDNAGPNFADNLCVFNSTGAGAIVRVGLSATAVPTSGSYVAGEFVSNRVQTPDGNNMVKLGWSRLTTGTSHTVGTDWRIAYASTVSPAA